MYVFWGFPCSSAGKESTWNAGDPSFVPGLGRSARERLGHPLQYFWASLVAQLVRIHLPCRTPGFNPWVGKIPWRREWLPTPVLWPGEFQGLYTPRGCKESDITEWLSLINDTEEESLAASLSNRNNPMVLTCFAIEEFGNICRAGGTLHLRVPLAQRFFTAMFWEHILWRRLSAEELMLLNCGVEEDSWESLGLQGDPTSPFWISALGFLWREWCWSWNVSTLATSCEELTHWKRLWCCEGLGTGGEGDDRG